MLRDRRCDRSAAVCVNVTNRSGIFGAAAKRGRIPMEPALLKYAESAAYSDDAGLGAPPVEGVSKIRSTVGIGASKHRAREGPSGPLPRLAGKARGSPVSPTRQPGT